ncbi:GGDEF domain-containing protein [Luteimonas sp. M1R5S18]|jgi:diguanylate cyclase (GGDEF)-like protein|uniref:diguanylate cyclase n=1 Tax=Luteimonas rhizosphaericola TaxID=3042024 RepID=A0ABT6JI66_9GAMM|nr:GGDEF domain-containing protein [Luteimonas rhizosphaericola]MDH5830381.1 GGDEF domain-containing protein [Luteimonas rhizosphaericola]
MQESASLRRMLATLFGRPDEVMLELGASGELLVAKLRALLSLLTLALPLAAGLGAQDTTRTLAGLAVAVFVNLMAQIWLALARNHRRHHWLPYATGSYDITVITGVLALLAVHDPAASLNSVGTWCFYLFAIALTAMRNDGRLTLYVGSLAIVQYALLVGAVMALAPAPLLSIDHGAVTPTAQGKRLVLLALMTLLTSTLVYRMQRLIEMSGRDGLTGVPNRAWLLQRLPRMFDAARRDGRTVSLALVDIDHFKRVYEEIGQIGGDRAIRHLAGHLREMLGEDEHLARIGGQEFVLVLLCPIGSAWERLDRYRRSLAERPFTSERGNEPVALTFSAGLAAFPQDGGSASALLGAADRRLQEAKRSGRNRVIARDT